MGATAVPPVIFAVTMVKDEEDIIACTIGNLLAQGIDQVLVADNLSSDSTRSILESLGDRVTVLDDPDPGYWQSQKMTRLAHEAGRQGADWVIPFDADEIWRDPHGRPIASVLADCQSDVLQVATLEHVPTRSDDPAETCPVLRMRHRRPSPKPAMKCCFRYHPDIRVWQGNHYVDWPGARFERGLEIREFQYRSFDQLRRKVRNGRAAYEATTLAQHEGAHWRELGALTNGDLAAFWEDHLDGDVIEDPAPLA